MLFSFACEAAGAAKHPAFPAPSAFEGRRQAKLGRDSPRERGVTSLRGATRRSNPGTHVLPSESGGIQYTETSQFLTAASGILDYPLEPVIGRAFARPV